MTETVIGCPISPPQRRLWRLQQADPGRQAVSACRVIIDGAIVEIDHVIAAVQATAAQYEILAMQLREVPGMHTPWLVPAGASASASAIDIGPAIDLRGRSEAEQLSLMDWHCQRTRARASQRVSVSLVHLGDARHALLCSAPSSMSDARGLAAFAARVAARVRSAGIDRGAGEDAADEEPVLQYPDIAAWLHETLDSADTDAEEAREYWRDTLRGRRHLLGTVRGRRSALAGPRHLRRPLSPELAIALDDISRTLGVSTPTVMLTAWLAAIAAMTGTSDTLVGISADGRRDELTDAVGLLTRDLPLTVDVMAESTFAAAAHRVHAAWRRARQRQEWFDWERALEGSDREPVACVYGFSHWELPPTVIDGHDERERHVIALACLTRQQAIVLDVQWEPGVIAADAAARVGARVEAMLQAVADDPECAMASIAAVSGHSERWLVTSGFNQPRTLPSSGLMHALVEAQAARTPERTAVVSAEGQITYETLAHEAANVARRLREMGVTTESRVGLLLERGLLMPIAMLGILKAGAAYVPLDPEHPPARLNFIKQDAGLRAIVTSSALAAHVPSGEVPMLVLDSVRNSPAARDCEPIATAASAGGRDSATAFHSAAPRDDAATATAAAAASAGHPASAAYVLYTSGSTGTPKGVIVSHAALCNHMAWMQQVCPLDADDSVLQKTAFGFDASVWEFFAPLAAGARLVMAPPGVQADLPALSALIGREQITIVQGVPSLLRVLLDGVDRAQWPALRRLFSGGEVLPADLARACLAGTGAELHNLYGPTEATIDATHFVCRQAPEAGVVPIGSPIANTHAYVLDSAGEPVPLGVTGELFLGGDGLARGYLRRPDLTADRFVPDTIGVDPGGRLYRTGDRVRWRGDGTLECLGRFDDQVKLHGYRIEPGEIAAVLRAHADVAHAAVIVRNADADADADAGAGAGVNAMANANPDRPPDARLVAYIVPAPGATVHVAGLRLHVRERLPEYMTPAAFVLLDRLPLTPHGKLDRAALPAPELADARRSHCPPRTPAEQAFATIWKELLRLDEVSVTDNFFELGGDSIVGMQVIARANRLGLTLAPRQVFELQTIEELARAATAKAPPPAPPAPSAPPATAASDAPKAETARADTFMKPLTSAQLRDVVREIEG